MLKNSWTEIGIIVSLIISFIGVICTIVSYFIKKWIESTENTVKATASTLAAVTLQHSNDLAHFTEKTRREIFEADVRNKTEVRESEKELLTTVKDSKCDLLRTTDDIKAQIREMDTRLVHRMDIANGRTGKLEEKNEELKLKIEKVITAREVKSNNARLLSTGQNIIKKT